MAGTRLFFQFKSGTHGLNVDIKVEKENCCVVQSVRVVQVLWECSAHSSSSSRASFVVKRLRSC